MSLLRLTNVVVRAEGRTLLELPGLEVEQGEILVVLGPTGAGKSTLLRVMGLLQRPTAGSLHWRGKPVAWPPPMGLRRRMAMVFQAPLLFSGSVFDNVAYGLRVRGERSSGLQTKVDAALRRFHIDHLAQRRAATLSGGEAQRTALARAVVLEPELLLLDEPLASLDAPIRQRLLDELRHVVREQGITCVHVTHEQAEAFALADRIGVLSAGRLLQVGTPDDVFYRPGGRAVAEFLQAGNLLAAEVASAEDGAATVRIAGHVLAAATQLPPGSPALACIRPEEILLAAADGTAEGPPPASDRRGRLGGTVVEVTDQGPTLEVGLDCGFPLRALVTRRVARELSLRPGARVTVILSPQSVHLIPGDDAGNMAR